MWFSKVRLSSSVLLLATVVSLWLLVAILDVKPVLVHAQYYQHRTHRQGQQQNQQQHNRRQQQQPQQQAKSTNKPKTYYEILGLSSQRASETEIKKAYRQLAKIYHPDKNRDNAEEAEAKFIELTKAYETLSDPQQRAIYDDELRYGTHSGAGGHRGGHGGGGNPFGGFQNPFFQQDMFQARARRGGHQNTHFYTMDDIFREFHGHQQHTHQQQQQQRQQQQQHRRYSQEEEEDSEQEIYMFQGPDGRMYYETRRKPKSTSGFHFQFGGGRGGNYGGEPTSMLWQVLAVAIYPLLQLFIFFMVCCSVLKSCCGLGSAADQDEQDALRRARGERSGNNSTTTSGTIGRMNNNTLPIIEPEDIEKKGKIVLVAMNTWSVRMLLQHRNKFRNDPLLFTATVQTQPQPATSTPASQGQGQNEGKSTSTEEQVIVADEKIRHWLEKLVADYRHDEGRSASSSVVAANTATTDKIVCIVALGKSGSRYDVIDVLCDGSSKAATSDSAVTMPVSTLSDAKVSSLVDKWLEEIVVGMTKWRPVPHEM